LKIRDAASTTRVLVVAILVSTVAFLDSTVVNLALPAITRDLSGGLTTQQWVVDGYLLALAATILPGGSISDLFGRVPVLRFGLAAFGTGMILAATATSPAMLITGRVSPIISFLFARRVGGSAARLGPRPFLIAGPLLAGVGYLLVRPAAHGFHLVTDLLPGVIVFATGAVITSTPLTALNLSSVETEHGGIASAIQNAVGRLSALIATACVGLIAASTLTDASFERLLQVSAVMFFIAAAVGTVVIANPTVPAEPIPCEVAALCRDRHDAHLIWSAALHASAGYLPPMIRAAELAGRLLACKRLAASYVRLLRRMRPRAWRFTAPTWRTPQSVGKSTSRPWT
jgi:MFS family permease